jgi:hypothetical protein
VTCPRCGGAVALVEFWTLWTHAIVRGAQCDTPECRSIWLAHFPPRRAKAPA